MKYKNPKNHRVENSILKPIGFDELFDIRVIICELETILNDDDAIEALGIKEVQTETVVVEEVLQKEDIPVGELGEEIKATVVPEK